jgi:hypothetical protein
VDLHRISVKPLDLAKYLSPNIRYVKRVGTGTGEYILKFGAILEAMEARKKTSRAGGLTSLIKGD